MDRIVRDHKPDRETEERPRYFSEYTARRNIVLLGDPGAGKSHLFRAFAAREGGRLVTVRQFLAIPVTATGEILYIDGLDEKRAGRGDRDTVDALVTKLFEAAPRKVRLSCRVADWLGESDLASLGPFFDKNGGEPSVLGLERLTEAERVNVLVTNGVIADAAAAFLDEAETHGLGEFLDNPQNLLMLHKAVGGGTWPQSRRDLFELSTELMLEEADRDHSLKPTGLYSIAELRPVAGALFAARLISDIEAIGISEQSTALAIPSYRTLTLFPRDLVRAALTRRVFVAGPAPHSADYAHRTTAEYLAAAWVADAVRGGLPFARVQALIGVDGQPAPELRGLHAWLAVHLPQHAEAMIEADPYGVLTYGDVAALSTPHRAHLVRALGRLAEIDPWFRSTNWDAPAIGGLSRADMIEQFRTIMRSNNSAFGLRSIIGEALALGAPQPELKDDLAAVLGRAASSYSERRDAVKSLLRLGGSGKSALRKTYRTRLGNSADDLHLRGDIVRAMYGDPFGPADIIALIE
ncbi:MAG TPA: hypothetical protein VLN59_02635, partial [Burkholderiales bacterium]|nr:hypothetical protein [Burkholderiales bacterium]